MAVKIEWIPPEDSSVGSVLIYRAASNVADEVGSRTIIDTIGAKDANGNWVLSYTDIVGTEDYVYRIQFWDGTGSSELSDPITVDYSELLASFEEVRRAAKISANSDIGSDEIYDAIKDASDLIYAEYGDPVKKTVVYIDSSGSPKYDITGDSGPIYQVRRVTIGNSTEELVPLGSYTINKRDGVITFTSGIYNDRQGEYVWVEWVPQIYNTFCKNLAALQLIEAAKIVDGNTIETPDAKRLNRIIEMCRESLRPKYITSDLVEEERMSLGDEFGHGADYVAQRIDRGALPSK